MSYLLRVTTSKLESSFNNEIWYCVSLNFKAQESLAWHSFLALVKENHALVTGS